MVYTDTRIGTAVFRVSLDYLSQSGNVSQVRVTLQVDPDYAETYNSVGFLGRTWHTGMSGTATAWTQWADKTLYIAKGGALQTLWQYQIGVTHAADGTATAQARFKIEATGTSIGGPAYTAVTSLVLPRIAQPPGAPTIASITNITADNARVTAGIPNNNGSPINMWTFRCAPVPSGTTFPAGFRWTEHNGYICDLNVKGSFGTGNVNGPLSRGTRYLVQVQCRNAYGWSPNSGVAAFTTLHTVPDKPPALKVTSVTANSISLTGDNPAYIGAGVTSTRWEISTTADFASVTYVGTGTAATFTGLTRFTSYWIRRRIANAIGVSVWSDVLQVTTAKTAPTSVRTLQATPSPTSVTLSWTAPADDGGSAITGYRVTAGGVSQTVTGLTATINGLTPNQPYTAEVRAINAIGEAAPAAMAFSTFAGPAAFTYRQDAVTALSATFTWGTVDQGSPITSQSATIKDGATTVATFTLPGTYNFITVPGVTYQVVLAASTPLGNSSQTFTLTALSGIASKPQLTLVDTQAGRATLRASTTANVPVLWWDIEVDGAGPAQRLAATSLNQLLTATGLLAGTRTFRVYAVTAYGSSPASDPVTSVTYTVPSVPRSVAINATKTATVTWLAPLDSGGVPLDGYRVQIATENTFAQPVYDWTGAGLTTTFLAVISSQNYFARVAAVNKFGASDWSAVVSDYADNFVSAVAVIPVKITATSAQLVEARATIQALGGDPKSKHSAKVDAATNIAVFMDGPMFAQTNADAPTEIYAIVAFRERYSADAKAEIPVSSTGELRLEAVMTVEASTSDRTVPRLKADTTIIVETDLDITALDYLADTYELEPIPAHYRAQGWF